ncbi:hypothetical protein WCE03_25850, partial [Pseudomonas guariconensis]
AIVPGAEVCVSGKVKEYFNQTQINADELVVTQPMVALLPAVDLVPVAGETLNQLLERHEGMQVRLVPESSLVVTRNFSFDYDGKRNNLVPLMALPSSSRPRSLPPKARRRASGPCATSKTSWWWRRTPRRRMGCCPGIPPSMPKMATCASATNST